MFSYHELQLSLEVYLQIIFIRKNSLSPLKIPKTVTLEILGFMSHDLSELPTFLLNLQVSSDRFLCVSYKVVLQRSTFSYCSVTEIV